MTCVTGVQRGAANRRSVRDRPYSRTAHAKLYETGIKPGSFERLDGDIGRLKSVEIIDQNPIGKSSWSNPVMYIEGLRRNPGSLFAEQPHARHNNLMLLHFCFNIAVGGRCEECQGRRRHQGRHGVHGRRRTGCEKPRRKRLKTRFWKVKYHGLSIYDILEMTVDDAIDLFAQYKDKDPINRRIIEELKPLQDVGLGYIKLDSPRPRFRRRKPAGEAGLVPDQENVVGPIMFIFDGTDHGSPFPRYPQTVGLVQCADGQRTHDRHRRAQHGCDRCADWGDRSGDPKPETGEGQLLS